VVLDPTHGSDRRPGRLTVPEEGFRMFRKLAAELVKTILIAIALVSFSAAAHCDGAGSVLLPPPDEKLLSQYEIPFNELHDRSKLRIKIYGLRLVPLHPLIWGTLKRERTNNRTMVPIKRYFLRASESRDFRLRSLETTFSFKNTKRRYMERMPHQKDPLFEMGIGGKFEEQNLLDKPLRDRFVIVRLSAFPSLPSGIFERNLERYSLLTPLMGEPLVVGRKYKADLQISGDCLEVRLDGELRATYCEPGLARGLISLQTSWHPIAMDNLRILADPPMDETAAQGSQEFSGIVLTDR
jgi:hypothetical protein